jgi:hypothetical protein
MMNNVITLLDVRNQLMGIFCQKSVFSENEIDSIKLTEDFNDRKHSIVVAALQQLEEMGLIKQVSEKDWMLTHPIGSSGQEVKMSMQTCNEIANTINTFLKAQNDEDTPRADALNINEGHIITLLQIMDVILMDGKPDSENEDEE